MTSAEQDFKKNIKKWLIGLKKDREWLADQCGVEKRSVDGWFSARRNVPPKSKIIIEKLMTESERVRNPKPLVDADEQEITLSFDDREWAIIDKFLTMYPETRLESYCRDKIMEFAMGMSGSSDPNGEAFLGSNARQLNPTTIIKGRGEGAGVA